MRRSIFVTALMMVTLILGATIYSCNQGGGMVWTGPDYPAGGIPDGEWVDDHALALTDDGSFGIIVMNTFGESLVLHTVLDADRKIVDVEGTVWIGPDGDTLVIRFDENGWPLHAVYGTDVFFFGNWDETTVDVGVMHSDGRYQILDDVDRTLDSLDFPKSKPGQLLELVKFNKVDTEIVLEELPSLGIRNTGSPYDISMYGRSMQTYQYSSGFSIVPPLKSPENPSPQSWAIWALLGTEFGACSLDEFPTMAGQGIPCGTPFTKGAMSALVNPELDPFYVFVSAGLDFGDVSPLSDAVNAYEAGYIATGLAKSRYAIAVELTEGVTDWAPFYFDGKFW